MKKYLRRLAEDDNFQLDRVYEILMNDKFSDDDIFEFAGHMHNSWKSANNDGYIDEKYDDFNDWLKDYAASISYDIIMKVKKEDEDFANNYALLSDPQKKKLVEKVNEYVLTKSQDIKKALDDAG